jgi:Fe-S oxidoreductase
MGHVWNLRKSGLSLLTGCKGPVKPTAGVEDVAVPPQDLPGYVAGLQEIMKPLGVPASFYGHAASGLLHVRPVVDLHKAEDLVKFRRVAEEVAALTKQYKGALAAEHGVGIARTEFMEDQLGPEMIALMRAVKQVLDPKNTMNPGKIISDGRYRFDTNLRWGAGYEIRLPFAPVLAFAAKDESFVGNLEQCNGCGGCRKQTPTMCPTFLATGEDLMSTRGRANTLRAALDGRLGGDPLASPELDAALDFCLSCKACKSECPSNVDLALLKAEMLHARHRRDGTPLAARLLSRVDRLGALGSRFPAFTNALLGLAPLRAAMQAALGIAAARPLPPYAPERFDRWFDRRAVNASAAPRGSVILWDDCFVRYHEPHIGRAAVRVLEAAGFRVALARGRVCCGRPAFSTGRLDLAREMGDQNARLLQGADTPIVFLEPSCYSMFKEDYRELGVADANALARRAVLFEHFLDRLLEASPDALRLREAAGKIAVHVHCHAKALTDAGAQARLLRRIPGREVFQLETGCCGMAGAFGAMEKTYAVSMQVAGLLQERIAALPPGTALCASGTSCRHQIEHLGHATPKHLAELLAEALD